jgi:hypothetical protein
VVATAQCSKAGVKVGAAPQLKTSGSFKAGPEGDRILGVAHESAQHHLAMRAEPPLSLRSGLGRPGPHQGASSGAQPLPGRYLATSTCFQRIFPAAPVRPTPFPLRQGPSRSLLTHPASATTSPVSVPTFRAVIHFETPTPCPVTPPSMPSDSRELTQIACLTPPRAQAQRSRAHRALTGRLAG